MGSPSRRMRASVVVAAVALLMLLSVVITSKLTGNSPRFGPPGITRGDVNAIEQYLVDELRDAERAGRLGSAALVLLSGGRIVAEHGFGTADAARRSPVDVGRTRYRVASVSKAVTAWGILKLVEEGKLRLDDPVLPLLKRWRFPGSEPYGGRVTVRHLLSHTAGLDDGLGYGGFQPGQPVQTLEESLLLPVDSTVGPARPIRVTRDPGTAMAYSSAGYTILELLIEEVTGLPFDAYMKDVVLRPLGMLHSSFGQDDIEAAIRAGDLATSYDRDLKPHPFRRYAVKAAVNLHATPRDLAKFALAFCGPNPVLTQDTVDQMLSPQPATGGSWGLGPTLFIENNSGGYVVGHDGGSIPAMGAVMRVNPATGNGIVLMLSGGRTQISRLANDWMYWETGRISAEARRDVLYSWLRAAPAPFFVAVLSMVVLYLSRRKRASSGPLPA